MALEEWNVVLAAVGSFAVLLGVGIAAMQFLIRLAVEPVAKNVAKLSTDLRDVAVDLRAEVAAQDARFDARFDRVLDGLRDVGERVARLEGALHMEPSVGVSPQAS